MVMRRTSSGASIDMEALIAQNETTVAVGNMRVNARGDQIDERGNIIKTAQEIAKASHANPTTVTEESIGEVGFTPDPVADNINPPKQLNDDWEEPAPTPAPAPTPPPAPKAQPKPAPAPEPVPVDEPAQEEWVEDPETGDFVPATQVTKTTAKKPRGKK